MTCYQRHLGWMFEELGLPYEKDERRRLDVALHEALELDPAAHCPEVWSALKELSHEETAALLPRLRELLAR